MLSRYKIQDILFVLSCVQLHIFRTIHTCIYNLMHSLHMKHNAIQKCDTYMYMKLSDYAILHF